MKFYDVYRNNGLIQVHTAPAINCLNNEHARLFYVIPQLIHQEVKYYCVNTENLSWGFRVQNIVIKVIHISSMQKPDILFFKNTDTVL